MPGGSRKFLESAAQDVRSFPRTFPDPLKPLGEARRRWVDKSHVLKAIRKRLINEDSVLKGARSPLDRHTHTAF